MYASKFKTLFDESLENFDFVSSGLLGSRNVYYSILIIHLTGLLDVKGGLMLD